MDKTVPLHQLETLQYDIQRLKTRNADLELQVRDLKQTAVAKVETLAGVIDKLLDMLSSAGDYS